MIADQDTVPFEIIALALSKTTPEAIDVIKPLNENADTHTSIRLCLGRMHYLGTQNPSLLAKFASTLYHYALEHDLDTIEEFNLMAMEYEYEIADVMGNTNENADNEFIQILSAFQKENSHQPDWFVVAS